jgi:hypothetical protein
LTISHTVQAFLDEGINVVGTVRSKDKGECLADLFKGSKANFEYVIVEDIGQVSYPMNAERVMADVRMEHSTKLSRELMLLPIPPRLSTCKPMIPRSYLTQQSMELLVF